VVASRRPDLIRTLTLISPAVPDLRPKGGGDALMPLLLIPGVGTRTLARLDRGASEARARAIVKLCFAHPERVPPNRMAEAIADIETRRGTPWAHDALLGSFRGLVRTYLARGQASPWRAMERITAPTLVIWGDRDRVIPPAHAQLANQAIPHAQVAIIEGTGHVPQLEAPERFTELVLRFLAEAWPPEPDEG
jgi:pimeloyl-ACP methyl ester carboxylesterase